MSNYYDGTKLLSLKDLNGNTPEIFICTSNRTAGKTTYFARKLVNGFNKRSAKFALLYRYKYELEDCAEKFYKDIKELFFQGSEMKSVSRVKGVYHDLFINDQHCGYAIALNCAEQIKKMSHLFNDVECMFMDEFQSETNNYCPREVYKFISVHTSIARGNGKHVRYVPVYMCGNPISILNPYYVEMGISERLTDSVKFLRGDGYVLEQGYNLNAAQAQLDSGFNKAFFRNQYVAYSSQCVYLNDNKAFIDKPEGFPKYLATIKYKGREYAIKEYAEQGIVYCDDKADSTFHTRISVTTDDHEINYVMLRKHDFFISAMRYYFDHGCFRFKDLRCKEAVLKALSY